MPKAEVGSTKHLGNKLKSKGLQRLRWYCQVCEKQCRDANGFKMHTQSESHVRQMLVVGEDPKKFINEYSKQFLSDFLSLLKTGHGEKQVHMNHFYQEYIANKEHIHMNATKWPSLTELAKHLGREGLCRVEETDKGLHISWIDNSPEALRRQEALKKKAAQAQGDEELDQRIIREQIRRAQATAKQRDAEAEEKKPQAPPPEMKLKDGELLTLSFGAKPAAAAEDKKAGDAAAPKPMGFGGMSLKPTGKAPVKNVFAAAKKNALAGGAKKPAAFEQPKKMSEAERIMKQEMDKKRGRESTGGSGGFSMSFKKQRND